MDNIILAHKVIHSLQSTKSPSMLLKLDLSKDFDKLIWNYLKATLLGFGFYPSWVTWIVNLTLSTLFSILVNGVSSKPFSPSRGIKQWDPLLPFLFILMIEGLSLTIKVAITNHSLSRLSLHGLSPPISHSQFMDGILMMGLPTVREATCILSMINLFCDALGMDVKLTKSFIFFVNMPIQVQIHITQLLGFTCISLLESLLSTIH
jgi:hypothetical protein